MNAGDIIGHYRIVEPLGNGGMGEVFVAEDMRLHRRVALKQLPNLYAADPAYRERFEREARAVAALNHPNIVTIHSVEEDADRLFLTMELVDGKTLSDVIPKGGLPIEQILKIGVDVADAMAAAQERGIIHRDLKPANIMITNAGRAKVLDFGLAKSIAAAPPGRGSDDLTRMASSGITGEGGIIGTVAYMSPEQAEGKPLDSRSDIFSLGVVLHEIATGDRPFKGESNVSILSSILRDTPSGVTDSNPGLPADLSRIIRRCLAKDPARRYQTALDLRDELEDLKQDTANGTAGTTRPRPAPAVRVSGARVGWVAVTLAGLAVAATALWMINGRRTASSGSATAEHGFVLDRIQRLTSTGTAFIAAMSPDGRYVVHAKIVDHLPALWTRQTATTSDIRIIPPADDRIDGVSISADGNFVYYDVYPGNAGVASLFKVPVLGGTPQKLLDDVDSAVAFSPDHQRMAFTRGSSKSGAALMIADADGTNVHALASAPLPDRFLTEAPSWSPGGKTILIAASSARPGVYAAIYAIDAASGAASVVGGSWAYTRDVAWLPDGRSFLATAIDFSGMATPQIWRVTYPAGERSRVTNDLNTYIGTSVSGDGRSLATVQTQTISSVYVIDPKGQERKISTGPNPTDGLTGAAWLPDGRLVYTSTAGGLTQLWIADADGSRARQLTSTSGPSETPAVAPDGTWIYFASFTKEGECVFRIAADGGGLKQLTTDGDARGLLVSPDGRTLYFTALKAGTPRLMRVSSGGGTPQPVANVYFRARNLSPDGARVAGNAWSDELHRTVFAILDLAGRTMDVRPEWPTATLFAAGGGFVSVQRILGKSVIMTRPAVGGAWRPLTTGTEDFVYGAAVSTTGRLAVARGQQISDVVVMTAK